MADLRDQIMQFADTGKWPVTAAGPNEPSASAKKCKRATKRALAEIRGAQASGLGDKQLCAHFQKRESALRRQMAETDNLLAVQVAQLLSTDRGITGRLLQDLAKSVAQRTEGEELLLALQTLIGRLGGATCRTDDISMDISKLLRQCTACLNDQPAAVAEDSELAESESSASEEQSSEEMDGI